MTELTKEELRVLAEAQFAIIIAKDDKRKDTETVTLKITMKRSDYLALHAINI
ncbi:hypothetical protein QWJ46_00540 [Rhizobium sp. CBN3]|uniref:hypothetical protein n=1 Tax=Rhizobium sp. CBN3 TaxID=3058045 RepID=UPI0026711DB9|nr:hypothetical protein [Rhizobium sp. CBN3]MDO3431161.1 hypothetical protein [Rhizobium sp. CBN3]